MSAAVVLAAVAGACGAQEAGPTTSRSGPATEYRGGTWFDGTRFVPRTMWVIGERFAETRPTRVDRVVELHGGFVVPPYGEGHNHWLEPALVDAYVQTHLREGIFYVKDQGTAPQFHDRMRPALGGPRSVDYISAHQGFTGPGGHPIELVVGLAGMGILPKEWAKTFGEGDALFMVSSEEDVERAWPRLMAGKPDFVKVFLAHSGSYAARRDDPAISPAGRGLDPALVPVIVARAHAAHLRVSAHIVDAHDVHVAIAAGVDDIAHMPFVARDDPDAYRLADADLAAAAARGVSFATTLDWIDDKGTTEAQLAVLRDNLARMRKAGNTIVIGTDLFRQTARVEANRIAAHHLMSNLELLESWCETTPRAIFHGRRIGRLAAGFEASFLVLSGDPLTDFAHTGHIALRVKQGHPITPTDAAIPPLE